MEACKAGKDVYVENPSSVYVEEGLMMVQAGFMRRSGGYLKKAAIPKGSRRYHAGQKVQSADHCSQINYHHRVHAIPGPQKRRRLVLSGLIGLHNVFPALSKLLNIRKAPGTPAGNWRNHDMGVNT